MTKYEASRLLEDVLDTLVEVGNGVTDELLHEAADKLFKFRNEYFSKLENDEINENMKKFYSLVEVLRGIGYNVTIKEEKTFEIEYLFADVKGKNIIAGFCPTTEAMVYPDINGKISADHKKCFDKWSKCPLVLTIPKNIKEMSFLLRQLEFWGSEEGFSKSNNYEFESYVKDYETNKS